MKTPKDLSRKNRCATYLYSFYSGWLNKTFFNLVVIVPPALIATLYSNNDVKKFIRVVTSDTTYLNIAAIGKDYVLLFNLFSFVWPVLLISVGAEIAKRANSNGVNVDSLFALIKSLDSIVGIKNKRFHSHVKALGGLTKDTAFESITDPNAQISEIVKEIGVFFNAIGEKRSTLIRVTFAVMKGGVIDSLPIFYPNDEPIKSSIDSLNSHNSAFLSAFRSKKMLIISDIKKSSKKKWVKESLQKQKMKRII